METLFSAGPHSQNLCTFSGLRSVASRSRHTSAVCLSIDAVIEFSETPQIWKYNIAMPYGRAAVLVSKLHITSLNAVPMSEGDQHAQMMTTTALPQVVTRDDLHACNA